MEFNPRRYAIYTRQSVESSEKTLSSCDVQFSICQDFMQSRAGPLCQWIGERLDDDGHSGATLKRPSVIYEVFPDGTRHLVKQIEPPTPVEYGKKIAIP